jgi:hypothetical protein
MVPKNPFYILELGHEASPGEIERQGRKLLGLFEVGSKKAATYTCPLGTFERDATMVREAMAALRDPKRRAKEACLVSLLTGDDASSVRDPDSPLDDAFLAGGYLGL